MGLGTGGEVIAKQGKGMLDSGEGGDGMEDEKNIRLFSMIVCRLFRQSRKKRSF